MSSLQFSWLWPNLPYFVAGAATTLALTVVATFVGGLLGILGGLGRNQGPRWVRTLVGAYVEMFRNTPMLAQALLVYLGLASLGFRLDPLSAGALALILNFGAYSSEIFRGGFASIPKSQREAADCLALSGVQSFIYIILPQAMRNVWVPLSGEVVLIMLASSVLSQISAEELTAVGSQLQSLTFRSFEVYIVLAVIYLGLSLILRFALKFIGHRAFKTGPTRPASRIKTLVSGG